MSIIYWLKQNFICFGANSNINRRWHRRKKKYLLLMFKYSGSPVFFSFISPPCRVFRQVRYDQNYENMGTVYILTVYCSVTKRHLGQVICQLQHAVCNRVARKMLIFLIFGENSVSFSPKYDTQTKKFVIWWKVLFVSTLL